jgi:hypothetical protein
LLERPKQLGDPIEVGHYLRSRSDWLRENRSGSTVCITTRCFCRECGALALQRRCHGQANVHGIVDVVRRHYRITDQTA